MLDVRRLTLLRDVAAHGTIAAAARARNYTRSAVSQQISALEAEAGTRLLRRRSGRMELTRAGEMLVAHTERILVELRSADASLRADAGEVNGLLRVGIPFGEGPPIMSAALTTVRARHPALEMQLQGLSGHSGADAVRLGQLDMAIESRYEAMSTPRAGVYEQLLGSDALSLCLPGDHPAVHDPPARLAELAPQSWVLGPRSSLGALILKACSRAGFVPRVTAAVDEVQAALGLVSLGWGITLAPELTPAPASRRIVRIPLQDVTQLRSTYILCRAGEEQIPAIAAVITAVALYSHTKFAAPRVAAER